MASARSRSIPPLLCLLLVVQTLRPVPQIDSAIALVVLPARWIAELAAPLHWLEADRVHATSEEREQLAARRIAQLEELDRALHASAYPGTVPVAGGIRRVHAEVVGRETSQPDRIRLRVEDAAGLMPGLPVVYGDSYVGVISIAPGDSRLGARGRLAPDELICDLITAKNSRIVGRLLSDGNDEDSRLVVGGLAPGGGQVLLDIHSPTWSEEASGLVVVEETRGQDDGFTSLANGFYLGDLGPHGPGPLGGRESAYSIRPMIDYVAGLHQVLILVEGAESQRLERAPVDPLETGSWRRTRALLDGDPSPTRAGLRIPLGSLADVRPGTALAAERALVGRVVRVDPFSATVRTLADPGLRLSAVAMVQTADGAQPHVLGLLTGRGKRKDGTLIFEWPATVPLEVSAAGRALAADVWTGSGEPGVPLGLYIGSTQLPLGPGPHLISFANTAHDPERGSLRVRLPDRAVLEGLEGGGE